MSAALGSRWVRAVYLDREVRADWKKFMGELYSDYQGALRNERDEVKCRWLQGKLQAVGELVEFVEAMMDQHRKAEQLPDDDFSSS